MLQDYSPQTTYVWMPPAVGTYGLQVWARQVGSTAAYAMVMAGIGREIVLIDLDQKRSGTEAEDISHAVTH